jgi:hypothetical protein
MHLELAEHPAERDMLCRGDMLSAWCVSASSGFVRSSPWISAPIVGPICSISKAAVAASMLSDRAAMAKGSAGSDRVASAPERRDDVEPAPLPAVRTEHGEIRILLTPDRPAKEERG